MAQYVKGTIAYAHPIDQINRKFVARKVKCSHKPMKGTLAYKIGLIPNSWMGGSTRGTYRAGFGYVSKNTFVVRTQGRTTAPSADELLARSVFSQVTKALPQLLMDITQVDAMQEKWNTAIANFSKTINGVSAKGYSFKGWVFAVQYAGKWNDGTPDPQYNLLKFPTAFDA